MNPRNVALEILRVPGGSPGAFERRLEDAFRRHPDMTGRDRAFAVHLVQGVLRWKLRLDWILRCYIRFPFERIEPGVLAVLRIALYQMFFMDRVPGSAAVNEAVKQVGTLRRPHLRGFANGILREIGRRPDAWDFPSREKEFVHHLSVRHSYPEWIVRKWIVELGVGDAERLLEAGNSVSPLILRAAGRPGARDELMGGLSAEGLDVCRTTFSPDGLVVKDPKGPVTGLEAFRKGLCTVQGEAAQIASRLLAPLPGEQVLDLCAGLGGKSTHLADLMGDSGLLLAIDRSSRRLHELALAAKRMGLNCILPVAADAAGEPGRWLRKRFDRVMLDAPCSALGTVSRHPDVKWCRSEEDIVRLSMLQSELLDSAIDLLRPAGRLLYATCTISREENEGVVEACADRHKSVVVEDLRSSAPRWAMHLVDDRGFLRCLPHVHGTEGFFAAMLVKR
jgi:16S rRNA (cytosine967-C5)-methyltransferase